MNCKKIGIAGGAIALLAVAGIATFRSSEQQSTANAELALQKSPRKERHVEAVADEPQLSFEEWQLKISDASMDEFRSLMDAAMKIMDPELRNSVVVGITDRWLKEDPSNFLKYMAALEVHASGDKMVVLVRALQESLTKLTPEQAASDEVLVAVQRMISYLAIHDPDKALYWANQWLLDDTKENALAEVARGYARTDISKALAVIETMTSPLRRGQALATVGGIWAMKDPEAALKWSMTIPNLAERALTLNQVLLAASGMNLDAASQQLKEQAQILNDNYKAYREAEMKKNGLSGIDEANDPVRWAEMREAGLLMDPNSPDVELMSEAGRMIASKLAAKDPMKAVEWAQSLETDFLKGKSVMGALEGWAKINGSEAIAYALAHYPNDPELIKSVYSSWAAADGLAAAEGVKMLEDPVKRAAALESVVASWTAKGDTAAAAAYLSQSSMEVSDGAKAALVASMSHSTPRDAWALAQTISDPKVQYRALKNAFSTMVIQDPGQASALLSSASLSNDTSVRLQDMLDAVVGK
jgi:hypothetical protein